MFKNNWGGGVSSIILTSLLLCFFCAVDVFLGEDVVACIKILYNY